MRRTLPTPRYACEISRQQSYEKFLKRVPLVQEEFLFDKISRHVIEVTKISNLPNIKVAFLLFLHF